MTPLREAVRKALFIALAAGCFEKAVAGPSGLLNMSLEQLMEVEVAGASHYPQMVAEAPASISLVTAEEIRIHGYRTLADILNSMRGLYLSYDRNYHYLGIRGFARAGDYNTRLLLLIDGVRYNDNVYDQAAIGTDFPIDVALIDRVEFIAGPGSSVYGANAFFGVVNVVTKNAKDFPGLNVASNVGSEKSAGVRASFGSRNENGGEWLLSATRQTRSGKDLYFGAFATPDQNNGITQHLDYDRSTSVFAKWKQDGLSLRFIHGDRDKGVPTASFGQVFNDRRSHTIDEHNSLVAEYQRELAPAFSMTTKLSWGEYRYFGQYVMDYPPITVNRDKSVGNWWGGEIHFLNSQINSHKLSFGGEIRRDARIEQRNFDIAPEFVYVDDHRRSLLWGTYLQDEIRLRDDLLLNAGLRYDRQANGESATNPRLGLIWKVREQTALKLIYGSAYRAANAYERYYAVAASGSAGFQSNPDLKPERIRSAELVLEHSSQPGERWLLSLFHNDARDLISLRTQANGNLSFTNIEGARAYGQEAEYERRWDNGLRLRASYSHQIARDSETGTRLANSPQHLLKLHGALPLTGTQLLGVEMLAASARKTLAARVPGYTVANINWTHSGLFKGCELSMGLYNIFDQRYADPASTEHAMDSIQQTGRTYRLQATYRF